MYIIYLDICAMVKVKTWVAFPPKKMIIWSVDLPGGTSVRRCLGGAKYVFFLCNTCSSKMLYDHIVCNPQKKQKWIIMSYHYVDRMSLLYASLSFGWGCDQTISICAPENFRDQEDDRSGSQSIHEFFVPLKNGEKGCSDLNVHLIFSDFLRYPWISMLKTMFFTNSFHRQILGVQTCP